MIWAILLFLGASCLATAALIAFASGEHDEELGHISFEEDGK